MTVNRKRPHDNDDALYMDTVNRKNLDFDFEKTCSVTLANTHVYVCLICGKYLQGRNKSSQAYLHSIDTNHHLFINLHSTRTYVLPDNYEVESSALDDIKSVINPIYTEEQVSDLDKNTNLCYDLDRRSYRPGLLGLNNMKSNDYMNVVIHSLARVKPLRDYLLLHPDHDGELARQTSLLFRKLWNNHSFKSHISPYELLQCIQLESKRVFGTDNQADVFSFINWFLNKLHLSLGGTKHAGSSIIHKTFQGKMKISSQKVISEKGRETVLDEKVSIQQIPFLFLSLDLPAAPLVRNELDENAVPQVPLTQLFKKFDGKTPQQLPDMIRRYQLIELPKYLILHIKRFDKNWTNRNPTVVNFNPNHFSPLGSDESYRLIANIVHEQDSADSENAQHSLKVQVRDFPTNEWYEIQDLRVNTTSSELLFLGDSMIQIWERKEKIQNMKLDKNGGN